MTTRRLIEENGMCGRRGADAVVPGASGEPGTEGNSGGTISVKLSRVEGQCVARTEGNELRYPVDCTLRLRAVGGTGGDGGHGAKGIVGEKGYQGSNGSTGHPGGSGGRGGQGGYGGNITIEVDPLHADVLLTVEPNVRCGDPGEGGLGGDGGEGGKAINSLTDSGKPGMKGPKGNDGARGSEGMSGMVRLRCVGQDAWHQRPFHIRIDGFGDVSPAHGFLEPGCWYNLDKVRVVNEFSMPLPQLECPMQVLVHDHDALSFDHGTSLIVPPVDGLTAAVCEGALRITVNDVDEDFLTTNEVYAKYIKIPLAINCPGVTKYELFAESPEHLVRYPLFMGVKLGAQVPTVDTRGALLSGRNFQVQVHLSSLRGHLLESRRAVVKIYVRPKYPQQAAGGGAGITVSSFQEQNSVVISDANLNADMLHTFAEVIPQLPIPGEAGALNLCYNILVDPRFAVYTPFSLHVDLQIEAVAMPGSYHTIQRTVHEVAVVEEMDIPQVVDVLLCVTASTPLGRIVAWRTELARLGLSSTTYDMTLYGGLYLTKSVREIMQIVPQAREGGAHKTLHSMVSGGTIVFFDDAVVEFERTETQTLHSSRAASEIFLNDAVFEAACGLGLSIVSGPTNNEAIFKSLQSLIRIPEDTVALFGPGREHENAPIPATPDATPAHFAKYLAALREPLHASRERSFKLGSIQETVSCSSSPPGEMCLGRIADALSKHVQKEFPEWRVYIGVNAAPRTTDDGCMKKICVLGDLFVRLSPFPRVLHRVARSLGHDEEWTAEEIGPSILDCVTLIGMEAKLTRLAAVGVDASVRDVFAKAVTAELTADAQRFYDRNVRKKFVSGEGTALFANVAMVVGAALDVEMLINVLAPFEAAIDIMNANAPFLTRFRYVSEQIKATLRTARNAIYTPETQYKAVLEASTKKLRQILKTGLDMGLALHPVYTPLTDKWSLRQEFETVNSVVTLKTGDVHTVTI